MQRKKLFIIFFLNLCALTGHAQVPTLADTLSSISPEFYKILESERANRKRSDSIHLFASGREKLRFLQTNLTQLLADTTRQAAMLKLQFENNKRPFHLPESAYKTNDIVLYTEGFATIGKAKIMGKMHFDKIWDDSLANNLNNTQETGLPFTHFATKAGKYEKQNYRFEAGIAYPILQKLFFTSQINYNYHWSTGSVDPRPENKVFELSYTPGLTFKAGHTFVGAGYTTGKQDGTYDIVYKNKMFAQSQLYPDRRLYINNGYGYIAQYTSQAYDYSKDKISGWLINAATTFNDWNVKINYQNIHQNRKNFDLTTKVENIDNPITQFVHSTYNRIIQEAEVFAFTENRQRIHQILITANTEEGKGRLSSVPGGINYLYNNRSANMKYRLALKKENRIKTELEAEAKVRYLKKEDFLSKHLFENTIATLSFSGSRYINLGKGNLGITAKPGVTLPFMNSLTAPLTQINVFTKKIAYAEYDYWRSATLDGQLRLSYYMPYLLRTAGTQFSIEYYHLQKLKGSGINFDGYEPLENSKTQSAFIISFQIFL